METPVVAEKLELDDVFDMSVEELRQQLENLGQDIKGLGKAQLQKLLAKSLSPKESGEGIQKKEEREFELEILKMKLEAQADERKAQAEERRLQAEERRLQAEERKLEAQAEERKLEAHIEERKLQAEARKLEAQVEQRKLELQAEERKTEAQERMRIEDRKLEELKLEVELRRIDTGDSTDRQVRDGDSFKLTSAMKFVPKFDSTDIEQYVLSFEKCMALHKVPREKWTVLLHPQLTGKAQKVFSELSVEDCSDYDIVKQALLTAYERVPEFYRKKFRNMTKEKLETYSNYAFRLQIPFQRWLEGENAATDIKRLCEVFKMEQFVNCLPPELHRWMVDKRPVTLSAAAKLADEYAVLYKQVPTDATWGQKQESFGWGRNYPLNVKPSFRKFSPERYDNNTQQFGESIVCNYCKEDGHWKSSCEKLKQRQERTQDENWRGSPKHVGLVNFVSAPVNVSNVGCTLNAVDRRYLPFCANGFLFDVDDDKRSVVCLRDSGSLQSLVSKQLIKESEYRDTGNTRLIKGISGVTVDLPLVEIRVDCAFAKGEILCGLINELPEGVVILVGNDVVSDTEIVHKGVLTMAQFRMNADERADRPTPSLDTQADAQVYVYENDCADGMHGGDLSQTFTDLTENVGVVSDSVLCDELIEMQPVKNESQPLVVLNEVEGNEADDVGLADKARANASVCRSVFTNVVSRVLVNSIENVHTHACTKKELEVSCGMLGSVFEDVRWMLFKVVPVGKFCACFVDLLVVLKDSRNWIKGCVTENMLHNVAGLRMNEFVRRLSVLVENDLEVAAEKYVAAVCTMVEVQYLEWATKLERGQIVIGKRKNDFVVRKWKIREIADYRIVDHVSQCGVRCCYLQRVAEVILLKSCRTRGRVKEYSACGRRFWTMIVVLSTLLLTDDSTPFTVSVDMGLIKSADVRATGTYKKSEVVVLESGAKEPHVGDWASTRTIECRPKCTELS